MKRKKLKILFRTYGGKTKYKQTGLGHIFRSINLANHLKKSASIHFLVEDYGGVRKILIEHGFRKISFLKKNIDMYSDIKQTIHYINQHDIDLIIIDKHLTKKKYLNELKNYVKTVIITDLKNINLPVDLLVNGYIGLKNKKFKNKNNSICLVGPSYQILNEKFTKCQKPSRKKFDVLVTFGGLDEYGIVNTFLDSWKECDSKLKVRIILGPISAKSKKALNFAKKYGEKIEVVQETKNMPYEISNSKFGFTTGGITSYEFACMGVPFAIICDDKHQIPTAIEWEKKRIAINLGLKSKKTSKKTQKVLKDIAENKIHFPPKKLIVDGKGVKRVNREILKISKI